MSKLQPGSEMNFPAPEIHETLQHNNEELKRYIAHIDHPLLQKTVLQVENDLDRLQIPYGKIISITVNSRFTRRYGCAVRCPVSPEENGSDLHSAPFFRIEVSSVFFEPGVPVSGLYENLIHEYLHTIPGCMNHGTLWKKYASYVNSRLHTRISATTSPAVLGLEEITQKRACFILECTRCHRQITRSRMCPTVAHPEHYRCTCGGSLILVKGSQNRDSHEEPPRYAVECTQCHRILYRQRMSRLIQQPQSYLCSCGGHFHRIQ